MPEFKTREFCGHHLEAHSASKTELTATVGKIDGQAFVYAHTEASLDEVLDWLVLEVARVYGEE